MNTQTISKQVKSHLHDIRTPMNAILGYARLAESENSEKEEYYYN